MKVQFKYFKITQDEVLNKIEDCLKSIEVRNKAVAKLAKDLGSSEILQWNGGGVAAFKFESMPDRAIWKKVKHGFMPKAKTSELKLMRELPKEDDYRDIIKVYGLGGEMIMGEKGSRGFKLHSSFLQGNRETNYYYITVPYQGDFDKDIDDSLIEIKEWEALKGVEGD
tara:strand:- start:1619 stop:2122 length:504 start_codon:yes stop_codon:yes gene_type:complete